MFPRCSGLRLTKPTPGADHPSLHSPYSRRSVITHTSLRRKAARTTRKHSTGEGMSPGESFFDGIFANEKPRKTCLVLTLGAPSQRRLLHEWRKRVPSQDECGVLPDDAPCEARLALMASSKLAFVVRLLQVPNPPRNHTLDPKRVFLSSKTRLYCQLLLKASTLNPQPSTRPLLPAPFIRCQTLTFQTPGPLRLPLARTRCFS